MHASGSIYNCNPSNVFNPGTSAPAPDTSIGPWIQSTGQTDTQAVSQVEIQGSVIINVITF
jgi:hypothetical protein